MSSLAFRPAMLSTSVGGIGLPPSGRSVIKTSSTVREIVANENHGLLRLCVSVLSCGQSPSFQGGTGCISDPAKCLARPTSSRPNQHGARSVDRCRDPALLLEVRLDVGERRHLTQQRIFRLGSELPTHYFCLGLHEADKFEPANPATQL
jgi:hypothetical protein